MQSAPEHVSEVEPFITAIGGIVGYMYGRQVHALWRKWMDYLPFVPLLQYVVCGWYLQWTSLSFSLWHTGQSMIVGYLLLQFTLRQKPNSSKTSPCHILLILEKGRFWASGTTKEYWLSHPLSLNGCSNSLSKQFCVLIVIGKVSQ